MLVALMACSVPNCNSVADARPVYETSRALKNNVFFMISLFFLVLSLFIIA